MCWHTSGPERCSASGPCSRAAGGPPPCERPPDAGWRWRPGDHVDTAATIRVFQDADANGTFEQLVLTVSCTFSPQTSNGLVPSSGFTCNT